MNKEETLKAIHGEEIVLRKTANVGWSQVDPKIIKQVTQGSSELRKVGRNESCPCQSGKKFKHCCINRISKGTKLRRSSLTSSTGMATDIKSENTPLKLDDFTAS